jgi:hypothetical protein
VAVAVGGLLFLLGRPAEGAVVYGTPGGVTAQPTDDPLWNSTVQWTLQNGGGTIIGPHSVLTAQHLNPSIGATLSLTTVTGVGPVTNTQTYTTTATTYIPNTDLAVWTVSGTFPSSSIVPLYSGSIGSETNKAMSMLGYGFHVQGTPVTTTIGSSTIQNGWNWSGTWGDPANGGLKNFGTNTVAGITNDGVSGSPTLVYPFEQLGGSEAIAARGDSGGGVFINVGGTYQLAGVQYAVNTFFTAPNSGSAIDAAIYDTTGLYVQTGPSSWQLATTVFDPLLQGPLLHQYGYASEIAPYLSQIQQAIVPEPASLVLFGIGGASLFLIALRRKS